MTNEKRLMRVRQAVADFYTSQRPLVVTSEWARCAACGRLVRHADMTRLAGDLVCDHCAVKADVILRGDGGNA